MSDEDSNMAASPLPDMDSDSMLGRPVDEEERWLDALEKGELDDNGELKKEIDESLLTTRQVRRRGTMENKTCSYLCVYVFYFTVGAIKVWMKVGGTNYNFPFNIFTLNRDKIHY